MGSNPSGGTDDKEDSVKIGRQVYLRISTEEPKARGTVSKLGPYGSFQVAYHGKGGRFWYPASAARAFGRI